ncbi:MAG: MFS transporter [Rickettsiales bacterium]|jgi:DHA1 family bicyclomycin/chloramphenicol resistance-like MFS transporter|nr:MFS transporter [Rickettsiales bacterium]
MVTIMFMDILGGAEIDLFTPSFPELQAQFNLSPFLVEGLLSINLIGFCLSLFFIGGLADRYGRKLIIFICLIKWVG